MFKDIFRLSHSVAAIQTLAFLVQLSMGNYFYALTNLASTVLLLRVGSDITNPMATTIGRIYIIRLIENGVKEHTCRFVAIQDIFGSWRPFL